MHIEQFIGSNPMLASTSCTDPMNNLKSPPKDTYIKTPKITLNLTETDQQPIRIRSRSSSPFWIKGQTSTYSEVVKTGCVSINNSPSPESKYAEGRISRKSGFTLLQTPSMRDRSKSPKDKCQRDDYGKNSTFPLPLDSATLLTKELPISVKQYKNNLEIITTNYKPIKRRSRSRKNRSTKNNVGHESHINKEDSIGINTTGDVIIDKSVDKIPSIKPKIIISDDMKSPHHNFENTTIENTQSQIAIIETYTEIDEQIVNDSRDISNRELLSTNNIIPLNTISSFSKSQLSLSSVPNIVYTDSCFDLNERLKRIFGSVDEKHYRQRVFDRPRSKSDTRDLNKLTQIFTVPNTNEKYTCRFERSAESVKNNSNRDYSTSGRRSFDNILSPFGNQTERSMSISNEHDKSVR